MVVGADSLLRRMEVARESLYLVNREEGISPGLCFQNQMASANPSSCCVCTSAGSRGTNCVVSGDMDICLVVTLLRRKLKGM